MPMVDHPQPQQLHFKVKKIKFEYCTVYIIMYILLQSTLQLSSYLTDFLQKTMSFYQSNYSKVTDDQIVQFLSTITHETEIDDLKFEPFIDDRTIERLHVIEITTMTQLMGAGMILRTSTTDDATWKNKFCEYLISNRVRSVMACTLVDLVFEFLSLRIPIEDTTDDDNVSEDEI